MISCNLSLTAGIILENQNQIIMDANMFIFSMMALILIAIAGLFLAWFFIKRARFKEKITLIEKGIDIKDLNLMVNNKSYSPWLRIGIIITGSALGALFVGLTSFSPTVQEAVVVLFTGVSTIIAYLVDAPKVQK